jgi:TM2 domain-containing membrane protein YozV
MAQCVTCGASLRAEAARCVKCGSTVEIPLAPQHGNPPGSHQPQVVYVHQPPPLHTAQCTKNKITAGILAILLGGIGIHKFYLGRIAQGILYVLFFWTYVPLVLGVVEGIIYLTMDERRFCEKYGNK